MRQSFAPPFLTLLVGSLCSQIPDVTPPRKLIPSSTSQAAVTRMVAADLTGHMVPDLVFVAEGELRIAVAPDIHNSTHVLSTATVRDCDVARQEGEDTVWFVGASGLQRMQVTAGQPTVTTIEAGNWIGATRLRLGRAGTDVVAAGIDATGTRVLLRTDTTYVRDVQAPVLDIALVDWNGDGIDDIAYGTATRLTIADHLGILVAYPIAITAGWLGRMTTPTGDYLVAAANSAGVSSFAWFHPTNPYSSGALTFDGRSVRTLTIADENGDQLPDVVLGFTDITGLEVLYNFDPGTPMFSYQPGCALRVLLESDAVSATALPVCADFDGDGDGDIAYVSTSGTAVLAIGYWPGCTPKPCVVGVDFETEGSSSTVVNIQFNLDEEQPGTIELRAWPIAVGSPISIAAGAPLHVTTPTSTLTASFDREIMNTRGYYLCLRRKVAGSGPRVGPALVYAAGGFDLETASIVVQHYGTGSVLWPLTESGTEVIIVPPQPPPPGTLPPTGGG